MSNPTSHSHGSPADPRLTDRVLARITSLRSWVDEWESLGRQHEQGGRDALMLGRAAEASRRFLQASAAYNFAQYVMFLDIARKRSLHESCVRAYGQAAPLLDPPAIPFEVTFRRHPMVGMLRLPPGGGPAPVAVLINGTNACTAQLSNVIQDGSVGQHLIKVKFADGEGSGCLTQEGGAQIYFLGRRVRYFVGRYSSGGSPPILGLYYQDDLSSPGVLGAPQLLAEGIEDLQFAFRVNRDDCATEPCWCNRGSETGEGGPPEWTQNTTACDINASGMVQNVRGVHIMMSSLGTGEPIGPGHPLIRPGMGLRRPALHAASLMGIQAPLAPDLACASGLLTPVVIA